jgi:homoserine O-acetyltransferase
MTLSGSDHCSASRGEVGVELGLRHGGDARTSLRYEMVGLGGPVLFVTGGISAGRHVFASTDFAEPGWWQSQSNAFDPARFRILSFDWVGADGSIDLPIDPADQAEAIALLLDHLAIERLHAFIGSSYGGMVGMHFASRYPERLGGLLAISAAGASHPFSSANRALQRRALVLGEAGGDPAAGVRLARAMAMLTYRTPEEFAGRFAGHVEVSGNSVRVPAESYLDAQGDKHALRMSAVAYRRLSESIDLHRIDGSRIRVPTRLVAVDSDALVPPADVEALARVLPGADFHCITSHFGHDAFLKEDAEVSDQIAAFLKSLENQS